MLFFFCCFPDSAVADQVFGYPVVLKGVESIRGESVHSIEAWSRRGKSWVQVPVQIDERNASGDFVLNSGLPFTAHSDDSLFDENDDFVVRGKDFGDDFTPKNLPAGLDASYIRKWKLKITSRKGGHGFLLVVARAPYRNFSPEPLVKFDEGEGIVETQRYRYRFHPKRAALLGNVDLKSKGELSPLLKSSHFIMDLKLPWYLPNFSLTDEDFVSMIESWRQGPIRSIVAVGVKFRHLLSVFNLHLFSELVFYEEAFQIPTVVEFVFDPTKYFKAGTGIGYGIEFADGQSWDISGNLPRLPGQDPEELFQQGRFADSSDYYYAQGNGKAGGAAVQVRVDPRAGAVSLPPYLITRQDFEEKSLQKHWGWLEDLRGDLGVFVEFSRVQKGTYDFSLDLFLANEADESIVADVASLSAQWSEIPTLDPK